MKHILTIALLFFLVAAQGQAPLTRFVANCQFSSFSLLADSSYRGNIVSFDDRLADGINASGILVGFEIIDGRGLVFTIDTVHSTTFVSADVSVTAVINRGFAPAGSGQVYSPTDKNLIPPSSVEQLGLSPVQKAKIDRHNIVLIDSLLATGVIKDTVYTITNVPDTTSLSPSQGDAFLTAAGDTLGFYRGPDGWAIVSNSPTWLKTELEGGSDVNISTTNSLYIDDPGIDWMLYHDPDARNFTIGDFETTDGFGMKLQGTPGSVFIGDVNGFNLSYVLRAQVKNALDSNRFIGIGGDSKYIGIIGGKLRLAANTNMGTKIYDFMNVAPPTDGNTWYQAWTGNAVSWDTITASSIGAADTLHFAATTGVSTRADGDTLKILGTSPIATAISGDTLTITSTAITGSGTDNTIPLWNGTDALDNSSIQENASSIIFNKQGSFFADFSIQPDNDFIHLGWNSLPSGGFGKLGILVADNRWYTHDGTGWNTLAYLSDSTTVDLIQDSILVYYRGGVETGRDTIAGVGGGGGGSADGVATAGSHDTGNEEIDITVASPGSDFSIDISALATEDQLFDLNLTDGYIPFAQGDTLAGSYMQQTGSGIEITGKNFISNDGIFVAKATGSNVASYETDNIFPTGNTGAINAFKENGAAKWNFGYLASSWVAIPAWKLGTANDFRIYSFDRARSAITANGQGNLGIWKGDPSYPLDIGTNADDNAAIRIDPHSNQPIHAEGVMYYDSDSSGLVLGIPSVFERVLTTSDLITDTDDQVASEVDITDSGGYYTGTEVEAALQEVGATLGGIDSLYHNTNGRFTTLAAGTVSDTLEDGEFIRIDPSILSGTYTFLTSALEDGGMAFLKIDDSESNPVTLDCDCTGFVPAGSSGGAGGATATLAYSTADIHHLWMKFDKGDDVIWYVDTYDPATQINTLDVRTDSLASPSRGGIYISISDPDTITVTTGGTFDDFTDVTQGIKINNFTVNTTTGQCTYNGIETVAFDVTWTITFTCDGTNENIAGRITDNAGTLERIRWEEENAFSGNNHTVGASGTVSLSTSDWLKPQITSESNGTEVIIKSMHILIKEAE